MLEEPVSSSAPTVWAVINSWLTPTVFFVVLQLVIATIYISSNIANNTNQKQNPQGGDSTQQPQQLPRSPSTLERLKPINFHSYTYRSQQPPLQVQNAPHSQTHEGGEEEEQRPQMPRSPTVLQRLKSINLHRYFPSDTTHESEKQHHLDHDEMPENHEPEKLHLEDTAIVEEADEEKEDKGAGPSLDEVFRKLIQGQGSHFNRSQSDTTAPASGEVPVKLARKMKSASTKSAFSHFKEDDVIAVENRRPVSVREGRVSAAVDGGGDDDGVDAKADDFINKFKEQLKLQRLDSVTRT